MISYPGSIESYFLESRNMRTRNKYQIYMYVFLGHYYELLEDAGYDTDMDMDSFTISLKPINRNLHNRLHLSMIHEWIGNDKVLTVFVESDDGFILENTFETIDRFIENSNVVPILEMIRKCEHDHRQY